MSNRDKRQVPGEFRVLAWDMPEFVGDYTRMDYGDPLSERSRMLLDEFPIREAVAGEQMDFERMLALKAWVRSQWDHGWSDSFDTVKDGLDILRCAQKGDQFCCGHYSMVFIDCARALGWPARSVGLSLADCEFPRDHRLGNVGHSVVEIWCNDYQKWIVMDPDVNCHYEMYEVPLSALEVHDAWLGDMGNQVEQIMDDPEFVNPSGKTLEIANRRSWFTNDFSEEDVRLKFERFGRDRVMDYYARLRIAGFEWLDDRCRPTFVRHFEPGGGEIWTRNEQDIYWTLNAVRLAARSDWNKHGAWLNVRLEHCMPWFDHYEAAIGEDGWETVDDHFEWKMEEGMNRIEVRAVNSVGRWGPASRVRVVYAKPRW